MNSQPEPSKRNNQKTDTPSESQAVKEKLAAYPDLTFYYGLSPWEIGLMPNAVKRVYIEALDRLLAQQQLAAIQASAFPNMKKGEQRRISSDLKRKARRKKRRVVGRPLPTADLERHVSGVGIGLKKVPKKEAGIA